MTKRFSNAIRAVEPDGTVFSSCVPEHYDISHDDLCGLFHLISDGDPFEAIDLAFKFGFVMGNRATHARQLAKL